MAVRSGGARSSPATRSASATTSASAPAPRSQGFRDGRLKTQDRRAKKANREARSHAMTEFRIFNSQFAISNFHSFPHPHPPEIRKRPDLRPGVPYPFRNLLRRLSALSYFHCGRQLGPRLPGPRAPGTAGRDLLPRPPVDGLAALTFARQQTTLLMGGLVGTATFRGLLTEFLPLLHLGELIHVGKGTVFWIGDCTI